MRSRQLAGDVPAPEDMRRVKVARVASWIVLATACLEFGVHGIARGLRGGGDFAAPYAQTRAWLQGCQPYDNVLVARTLRNASVTSSGAERPRITTSLYPPTSFPLLIPFALAPWRYGLAAWVILSVLLVGVQVSFLLLSHRHNMHHEQAILSLALLIGLAPYHTGLVLGQPAIPATACVTVAVCLAMGGREVAAGVLLALAAAVKLQIGAPFLLHLIVTRRWRGALVGILFLAAIALIGIFRMTMAGVSLAEAWNLWRDNLAHAKAAGGGVRFTIANPGRFDLINLHVLLHSFTDSIPLVRGIVYTFATAVGLSYCVLAWKAKDRPKNGLRISEGNDPICATGKPGQPPSGLSATFRDSSGLLVAGTLGVLMLLSMYHRLYDAALLALPIAWAVSALGRKGDRPNLPERLGGCLAQIRPVPFSRRRSRCAWVVLIASLVFLVPGGTALTVACQKEWIPEAIASSSWWNAFVMPHQIWALLVILAALMAALADAAFARQGELSDSLKSAATEPIANQPAYGSAKG